MLPSGIERDFVSLQYSLSIPVPTIIPLTTLIPIPTTSITTVMCSGPQIATPTLE